MLIKLSETISSFYLHNNQLIACLSCAEGSRAGLRTPGGVSPEWSRRAEPPPSPCAHAAGDAAQGTVGLLGCQCPLLSHAELLINQHPQVLLLLTAALNPFPAQPVFVLGIALTHVQDLG